MSLQYIYIRMHVFMHTCNIYYLVVLSISGVMLIYSLGLRNLCQLVCYVCPVCWLNHGNVY